MDLLVPIRTYALIALFLGLLCACESDEARAEKVFQLATSFVSSEPTRALELFDQVIELDSTRLDAHEEVAAIHLDAGDFGAAQRAARASMPDPTAATPRTLETLGRAERGLGNWEPAARALRAAVERDPERAYLLPAIGQAHLGHGDIEAALAAYREAIEANVEPASMRVTVAGLLVTQFEDRDSGLPHVRDLPDNLPSLIDESLRAASSSDGLTSELEDRLVRLRWRFEDALSREPDAIDGDIRRMIEDRVRETVIRNGGLLPDGNSALAEPAR